MSTIKEGYIINSLDPIDLDGIDTISKQMKYSVCLILRPGNYGTGFFCKLRYNSNLLPLLTNNHIIDYEYLNHNKNIKISLNNNEEKKTIEIDKTRIIITNKDLDYTLIEIKPNKDNIDITKCLELDENAINTEEQYLEMYIKKSAYVIHYPKGDKIVISYGLISNINDQKILHLCNTDDGSSGGPIMSLKDFKVIGIHYGYYKRGNINCNVGTFFKSITKELNEYKEGSYIVQNSLNNNYNNNPQNINFNYNIFAQNNNYIYQQNINNNILQNNINNNMNNMIMFSNNNMNNFNINNEEFPIQIISKNQYNLSIMAFPSEKNFINIIFQDDSDHKANVIIPSYKKINVLFKIYSNVIGYDIKKLFFYFNGSKMDNNDQRKISQAFSNIDHISVSFV